MRGVQAVIVALGLTVLMSGCRDRVPKPASFDPVSMTEAEDLARRFEAAMAPCDAGKLDELIDTETILRRAVAKANASARARREFLEGARSGMSVGSMLCQNVTVDDVATSFELLRIREVDGRPRPLFRLLVGDLLNYHELELGKSRTDHQIWVTDLHIYATGERMSDTIAQLLERSVVSAKQGASIDAAGETLKQITDAKARGDHDEVRRLLASLPPAMRHAKPVLLIELSVASDLDDASYGALIAQYERSFPGDASLDLISLDGAYLRKDVPAALATLERIDHNVGGDSYLGLLRASVLMIEPTPEHLTDAERWAKVTTDGIPTLVNGWWTLATVRLLRDDHAGVVAVLERLEADFDTTFDLDAMRASAIYESFLRSPEFEAWWSRPEPRARPTRTGDLHAAPARVAH